MTLPFKEPRVDIIRNGSFEFVEDWIFCSVMIPRGFISDGTTSPWYARSIVPRFGKLVYASFIHDFCLTIMSRKEAALKFRECLKALKASKFQCVIRYIGVRINDRLKYG